MRCVEHRGIDLQTQDRGGTACLRRPEAVLPHNERGARLGELERPDQALAVVRVHGGRRARIELLQPAVRRVAIRVHLGRDPCASLGCNCRRDVEVGERSAEVEPGPARHDCDSALGDERIDLAMRERRVRRDAHLLVKAADRDQTRRPRGLVGEDGEAAVDLHRVRRDHPRPETVGESLGDGGLPGCRRTEDGDDLGLRHRPNAGAASGAGA